MTNESFFTLKVISNQVYNPSDKWMECEIQDGTQKIAITPIPPRSLRTLPIFLANPQIISELETPQSIISQISKYPAHFNPIKPNQDILNFDFDEIWKGKFKFDNKDYDVQVHISFFGEKISGWFENEKCFYYISGSIEDRSGKLKLSAFSTNYEKYDDLNGRLFQVNSQYIMSLENEIFSLSLSIDIDQIHSITSGNSRDQENSNELNGSYEGFIDDKNTSHSVHLELIATNVDTISGKGMIPNSNFEIEGFVSKKKHLFFFFRKDGYEYIFYQGNVSFQDNVFFSGQWVSSDLSGKATFIKVISN